MLPNFWSRTGKIEEGDVSISYLDFGQVQEKMRKGGVNMLHLLCFIRNVYKERYFQGVEIWKKLRNLTPCF